MSVALTEFDKLDIRICRVLKSERIRDRQKLLRLVVDIGSTEVQIVAGGGEFYPPDYFIGKNLVILANLQPRVIAGVESNGMLLAADDKGKPIWLTVSEDVPPGTRIR